MIGRGISAVQTVFVKVFNEGTAFERDGSQFDGMTEDGDTFKIGEIDVMALHVPGHTPDDMAYVVGDAIFTGDTLFMHDYGSARADFPGGDERQFYHPIRWLLSLHDQTSAFLCHDYKATGRDAFVWDNSIGVER